MKNSTLTLNCLTRVTCLASAFVFGLVATASGELNMRQVELAEPRSVAAVMERVAAFQMKAFGDHAPTDWKTGTFFSGVVAAYQATGNSNYLRYATDWSESAKWKIPAHPLHADQLCTGQTYLDLFFGKHDPAMIADLKQQLELMFNQTTLRRADLGHAIWNETERPFTGRNLWWWCDALYMAPPVLARMSVATGDPKYRKLLHQLYWDSADFLYDQQEHLFFRDQSQFKRKSPNGKKVFWGRGNGWVYAGLIRTLDYLPKDDPMREKYIALFREMTQSILQYQQPDGLWRSSLNDPAWFPAPETSCTSFFCFGLLAGINRGYLDKTTYLPAALSAWEGLQGCLNAEGRLGYAQQVAAGPGVAKPDEFIDYTHGAFLLAGSELYKMNLQADAAKNQIVVPAVGKSAAAVATPAPATVCRYVPERLDDFAWENDLVAFRAYGPAIRSAKGTENSGIDCWLKRVKYPIVDKWYAGEKHGVSYHLDHGEGNDPYHVGASRGCGGLGIWQDSKIVTAGPYQTWKIISTQPDKSVFVLTYDYDLNGRKIRETKRITIGLGSWLFQAQSTFTENGKPVSLDIAIGITTHNGLAKTTLNAGEGWMACWEKIEGFGLGTGVVITPNKVKEMREAKSLKPDDSHALLLTHTDDEGEVAYAAGYGWEKAGEITSPASWEKYLSEYAASRHGP